MSPPASSDELLNELVQAWWRGELAASGAQRVNVLHTIFRLSPPFIAFDDDQHIKELTDGTVDVRPFLVPLSNSVPSSWDDHNCSEAFEAIANAWCILSSFELMLPIVRALEFTEVEFSRWLRTRRQAATFWGSSREGGNPLPARSISTRGAAELAKEYYNSPHEQGKRPTQIGFEEWLKAKRICGSRLVFRTEFKKVAGPLRRGRRRNE
jgi:hypothetical protein